MNLAASEASRAGLVSSVTSGVRPSWSDGEYRRAMVEFRRASRISRMQRGVKVAAELLDADVRTDGRLYRPLFVTLTYRASARWRPRDIADFLKACRERFARKGEPLRYVWVLELTRRGVPHYHVMFWVRASLRLPTPDRAGLWPHGHSQVQRARSPIGYLIKYASKGEGDQRFPRGARLFGCGGLSVENRAHKRWRLIPLYIRVQFNIGDGVRRCRGGGWLSTVTGEWRPAATLFFDGSRMQVRFPSDQN